ncbi:hypothetical protein [Endozoicomonas elysicola]|uniref:Uncharacterized protein n=1 Tax=Endozoicomonas elysicola TaxID=305900 RepID=A0A081KBJ0_9GAMM|nr:hypothetical protein [Endozoicomonas elysicola]KEI71516.1 hypothetical protein GV64_12895 [Endozoicomonas elysicola]
MKKVLTPVVIACLAMPLAAQAEKSSSYLPQFSADDLNIDGSNDIILVEAPTQKQPGRKGPPRTNFVSGIEYTETIYENQPKITNIVKILADGSTKFHKNWRLRYVLSQADAEKGIDQSEQPGRLNLVVAPRFEKWVSPRFSYFIEGIYKNSVEGRGWEKDEFVFKPGGSINLGRHFFNVVAEYQYKETSDHEYNKGTAYSTGFHIEPTYIYRMNPRMNIGLRLVFNEQQDESQYFNKNVKALVNYRFNNNIRTEFNVVVGKSGQAKNDSGHNYTDYNLNTSIPINKTFTGILNFGYRLGDQYNPNQWSWGDREGIFTKIAVSTRF